MRTAPGTVRAATARRRGIRSALAGLVVVAGLLTGCAPSPDEPAARPVTAEESELLAVARFRNFDAGVRAVSFSVDDSGTALRFDGWYDYASRLGYGALVADGTPNALLAWDGTTLWAHAPVSSDPEEGAPLPPPDAEDVSLWRSAPLDAAASRLHAIVDVVSSLGADRPDNPLLLRQGGALFLGTAEVDGVDTTLFAGPLSDGPLPDGQTVDPDAATTRYWVDATGVLRRAGVRLGGAGSWETIDFGPADDVTFDLPFAEAGP